MTGASPPQAESDGGRPRASRRRRRQQAGLERVLGTPALFATAYGNVGSSIYYALGVTAVFALGLTPIVFIVSGLIFACTAATYAEGTVRFPEAGGSSSFARHLRDVLLPAPARGLPAAASEIQDAVAVARRLRGPDLDPRRVARKDN